MRTHALFDQGLTFVLVYIAYSFSWPVFMKIFGDLGKDLEMYNFASSIIERSMCKATIE
jgi:hypothetical protein